MTNGRHMAPAMTLADGAEAAEAEPPERLLMELVEDDGDWSRLADPRLLVTEAARAIAAHGRCGSALPATAAVALSSDAAVRALNKTYRRQDKPTNVLSFPAQGSGMPGAKHRMLGDIMLADGVLAREAAELGIPLGDHFQHLVVHGALHLMGFDHETERDAAVMERLETEILARLGIRDPYAPTG